MITLYKTYLFTMLYWLKKGVSMEEVWKDVEGSNGRYQVSNLGRVKAIDIFTDEFKKHKVGRPYKFGIIAQSKTSHKKNPYPMVRTRGFGKGNSLVHRLVAKAFVENPDNKPHVNHIDADPTNNNSSNLEWCTPKENIYHSVKVGNRVFEGEKSPRALLTQGQVDLIREMYNSEINQCWQGVRPFTQAWLGKCFKVDKSTIGKIITGANWGDKNS